MEKIKGMCRNEACEHFEEIFEVEKTDPRCPYCSKELFPMDNLDGDTPKQGPNWKIIAGAVAVAALLGGGAYFAFTGNNSQPDGITLNKHEDEMFVGETDTLKAIVTPEGVECTLKWASNNPDVATVENGIVTFVASGDVKIGVQIIEHKELKAFCDYKVEVGPDGSGVVNWIKIMDGNQHLRVGETKELSLDCDPGNAFEPVEWSSSNTDVVTVVNGKITAKASGTAKITATTKVSKKTANIQVVVKNGDITVSNPGTGTLNLPYGTYTGKIKNGKPHGEGRLVYTKEHVINSHDIKKRTAKSGESVQGQFVNGEITIGKHFNSNGSLVQALNFGVAE